MTEPTTQFYVNAIATPLAVPKLDKKILRLTKKCKKKLNSSEICNLFQN